MTLLPAPHPTRAALAAMTESELVALAQTGDHGAFEVLFDRYQDAIVNHLYRLMQDKDDAHDMTQDTFLKAYLALPETTPGMTGLTAAGRSRFRAWLFTIATHVAVDQVRHRKLVKWMPWEAFITVFHPSQVARDNPERDAIRHEDAEEMRLLLDELQPEYRLCLLLREYHDLTYGEIADALNITRVAVKSRLFRAREQVRWQYAKAERQPGRAAPEAQP